jgi:hypothetical protein
MALSIYPNLTFDTAYGNVVATNSLSGTITNSIDYTTATTNSIKTNNFATIGAGAVITLSNATVDFTSSTVTNFPQSSLGTWTNNIAQTSGKTALLGATTWLSGVNIDATGASPRNFALTGANGNSVDNAALPATLTSNVSNASTTTTALSRGTAGTGGLTVTVSKNYTTAASNTALTIATISGVSNTAADKWKMVINISGSTSGTSTGEAVNTSFTLLKTGLAGVWKIMNGPSWATTTTKLAIPTITATPASTNVVINQPATTTTDGAVHYNVEIIFTGLNSAAIATPTLS